MPFVVVVDTSVSLPATLSSGGMMRRFWVVLAFGALTYEVEHRQLELDELSQRAEREGGAVGGLKEVRDRVEVARNRRAALVELLPDGTPDDWVAIGSVPLFDKYERKLREIGQKLDPALRDRTFLPFAASSRRSAPSALRSSIKMPCRPSPETERMTASSTRPSSEMRIFWSPTTSVSSLIVTNTTGSTTATRSSLSRSTRSSASVSMPRT
jgi:hypothetical protein